MTAQLASAAARQLGSVALLGILTACVAERPAAPAASEDPVRRVGNLEVRGVPEIPGSLVTRMQQYRNTRSAELAGWLGDAVLIGTRFADTTQLHRVDRPLGARRQLTYFDEPVADARVAPRPDPGGFVYARDAGGSEFYQLYWFDVTDGSSRLLTDGRSRYIEVVWANAGDTFAYTTTARNGQDWDIHLQGQGGEITVALEAGGVGWVVEDFAPDDQRLLVSRYVSINESYLYELDLADGSLRPLLEHGSTAAIRQARYTPDGTGVFFTSDLGAEFLRLHRLDLASAQMTVLTGDITWDVEAFEVSPTGEHLAFTVNEGGYSRLYVWQLPNRVRLALPEVPRGVLSELTFHPNGDRLGFSLSLPTAPTDVYSVDLKKRSLTRWTESETGGLDRDGFVAPELIAYPTFDQIDGRTSSGLALPEGAHGRASTGPVQRRIPAFVYRPDGPGPHPVYVSIHGISNFVTFLTNTEDYRRDLRRAEYGDERDPAMRAHLQRISPLSNVDRIRRPLLITQGANDPRVPAGESEQIYQALSRRGVPVWYVLALDEGHGFRKKANSDYAAAATVLFLQRFALNGAPGHAAR